jgi:acetyl esterase/lipase
MSTPPLRAQAVGGEIMARIAGLWQTVGDEFGDAGDLQAQRSAWEALLANFEPPEGTHTRPVNANGVPSLVQATDPSAPPAVLFIHGGSYVLGSAYGYRPLGGALAKACGTNVLIPDYRLAPEHPFPAALDDVYRAYAWMRQRELSAGQIVVVGDSSGAALTLALLLKCRDEGVALPAGAVLLTPLASIEPAIVSPEPQGAFEQTVRAFWEGCVESYLAGHTADDPLVNPMRGDLTGLSPLLIQAGTRDFAIAEARALHDRAIAAGVFSQLQLYGAEAHSFHLFWPFLPEAVDAIEATGVFVREVLANADDDRQADTVNAP